MCIRDSSRRVLMKLLLTHLLVVGDWLYTALGAALALPLLITGPGSLSSQVLRLLTRDNEWSGTQTFDNGTLLLESALADPVDVTNRLYSVGGNLFWNGTLVTTASGLGTVTSVIHISEPTRLLSNSYAVFCL